MTVLVLNHKPLGLRPIGRWLQEAGDLVMVTSRSALASSSDEERRRFVRIVAVDDYASADVELAARALAARHRPGHVASNHEYDLIRAAGLRERFGLPGQPPASARAYRDKLVMRRSAALHGIRMPAFAAVREASDVSDFARRHGLPLVLKPRLGTGSTGITVIRDRMPPLGDLPLHQGFLVEQFVEGRFYHVDGIVRDGRVVHCWPSRYSSGNLEAVIGCAPLTGALLDADDPLRPRLQGFAADVVASLPATRVAVAFHLEAWVDGEGRPVLCEVTSRGGGGPIAAAYGHAFDLDLLEESFRGQAELPLNVTTQPPRPRRYAGWAWFMNGHGAFTPPPVPAWLPATEFTTLVTRGEHRDGARNFTDAAASAIAEGASAAEVEDRIAEITRWWEKSRPWR